jgi:hypothetical protein
MRQLLSRHLSGCQAFRAARGCLTALALVIVSAALGLAGGELGYRAIAGQPLLPDHNFILGRMLVTTRWSENVYHPLLGWIHRSNYKIGSLTTGEYGVRMNDAEIKPVPRNAILVVGDSFPHGSGVANHETWPAVLERQLGEPVINAALGGYGTDQIVLSAEVFSKAFAPRTLILTYLETDIERAGMSVYGGGVKPYFTVVNNDLDLHNVPIPQRMDAGSHEIGQLRSILGYSLVIDQIMVRLDVRNWYEVSVFKRIDNDPNRVSCLLLERIKKFADERGVRLLFVMQYGPFSVENRVRREPDPAAQIKCARNLDIATLDTWDAMKHVRNTERQRWRSFFLTEGGAPGHMSREGNAFIAALVADALIATQ